MKKISLFEQSVMQIFSFMYCPFKRFHFTKKITYKEFLFGKIITTSSFYLFLSVIFPKLFLFALGVDFFLIITYILFIKKAPKKILEQIMPYEKTKAELIEETKSNEEQNELKNELLITSILNKNNQSSIIEIEKEKELNY